MEPSLATFDSHSVTAEELAERFPDIGLFVAEDIVDARRKGDGVFPGEEALVALGLTAELAREITAAAAVPEEPAAAAAPVTVAPSPAPPPAPEPTRTLFDVAAAVADVADETDVEDAPESRPARTPPPAIVAAPPVSAPPVAHAESAPPAEPTPSSPKRSKRAGLVAMLVTVNLAAIAGVAAGYQQERGTRKEVVTISSDVGAVKVEQVAAKERADDALAKLAETRTRLDEQEKLLAQTKARVAAAEGRLQEDERAAHEHETHEAQESAALNGRVIRVEDKTMKLDEALKQLEAFDR